MRLLVFTLLLLSFSASSAVQISRWGNNGYMIEQCYGVTIGSIVDPSSMPVGKTCSRFTSTRVYMSGTLRVDFVRDDGRTYLAQAFVGSATCEPPSEINPTTGVCEEDPCTDSIGSETDVGWYSNVYGTTAGSNWCSTVGGGCASQLKSGSSFCGTVTNGGYNCIATYIVTGPSCQVSDEADDNWCNDAECSDMVDKPDPTNPETPVEPETPTHQPSDPTSPIDNPNPLPPSDSNVTETDPEPVDPQPDVTEPELTPESNGDIVSAVANLNRDTNKALTDLNVDINKTQADINTELTLLNANVRQNSEQLVELRKENIEIYQNNKALIQNLNRDVTTAMRNNTERLDAELERVGDSVDEVGNKLDIINENIGSLTDVDTSGAGSGTCIDSDSCTGFYESSYPDGLKGILTEQMQTLKTQVLDGFLSLFGTLDLSNAQRPSFTIPVLDFGDFDFADYVNLDAVFAFVRFVMIYSSIMASRRIIFGG